MARYALLIQPSANRVYSGASAALTQAELQVFSQSVLDGRIREIARLTRERSGRRKRRADRSE